MSGPYAWLSASGIRFAGMLDLMNAAEREKRDGGVMVFGAIPDGSHGSLGFELLGRLVRTRGVVEFEDLEPVEEEGGGS